MKERLWMNVDRGSSERSIARSLVTMPFLRECSPHFCREEIQPELEQRSTECMHVVNAWSLKGSGDSTEETITMLRKGNLSCPFLVNLNGANLKYPRTSSAFNHA